VRRHRRGVLAATAAAAAAAAALLAACGSPSGPPAALPGRHVVSIQPLARHTGAPIDVGRVRLWLPPHWQLSVVPCPPGSKGCAPSCPPGAADTVYVTADPGWFSCRARPSPSVWVVPRRFGTAPATRRRLAYGHGSVLVAIPRLGVTLYGFTPRGARVARTFGDATVTDVLAAGLPVAVPPAWRRVSLGALSVAVPRDWPVRRGGVHTGNPGSCDASYFPTPYAFTGFGDQVYFCPMIDAGYVLRFHATPGNGVWLQTDGYKAAPPMAFYGEGPMTKVVRHLHGVALELFVPGSLVGSDYLAVVARHDGRVGQLIVGLGRSPSIAEAILSSLRLTAR
jgi:hypothetical protein